MEGVRGNTPDADEGITGRWAVIHKALWGIPIVNDAVFLRINVYKKR